MASRKSLEVLKREFEGITLGDERLERRVLETAEKLAARPAASLPTATRTDASLEGTYRLLGNEAVTPEKILAPHRRRTSERAEVARRAKRPLFAIHDTTEATFGGEYLREGLGFMSNGSQGFFAHVTLLASRDGEEKDPLGVLQMQTLTRTKKKGSKSGSKLAKAAHEGEAQRWLVGMQTAQELVPDVVHVADREADAYWLIAKLIELGARFIFRNKTDRRVLDEDGEIALLRESLRASKATILERTVSIGARHPGERGTPSKTGKKALKGAAYVRTPTSKKRHPARDERMAKLQVQAARFELRRPNAESRDLPASLTVNAVRVFEPSPPAGQAAIEWFLLTSEPIDTPAQLAAIVDGYRTRWLIEEFFKALKTGCNYENSQLERLASLQNLLAFYLPIAWRMLRMRTASRTGNALSATEVLTEIQLKLLAYASPTLRSIKEPSAHDALLAVAALGGHLKNNGPPGWLTIGRGFDELLAREVGFIQAVETMKM